jgi:hypothetical protein
MALHTLKVSVGDQVYLAHNDEEVGAVREVARDHLIVYVENSGDVQIAGPAVKEVHDGKVVLDPSKLDQSVLAAMRQAHQRETD